MKNSHLLSLQNLHRICIPLRDEHWDERRILWEQMHPEKVAEEQINLTQHSIRDLLLITFLVSCIAGGTIRAFGSVNDTQSQIVNTKK